MKYKKILYILAILLWVMGFVGGVGYVLYVDKNAWPVALGVAANGVFAFSKIKEFWNKLLM